MTKRDNFIAFFKGEDYDHVPILSEDTLSFQPRELHDYVARGFVADAFPFDRNKEAGGKGWFGVEWEFEPSAGGSIDKGRSLDDVSQWKEKIVFPDLDAIDWEGIAKKNADYLKTDRIICATIFSTYFERLIAFMDFMDAAMTMVDPDFEDDVKELFDKLTNLYCDYIERMHKYFNVEMIEMHDDWGTQASAMMSKETHRELIYPYVKRCVDKCHELGIIYMQHSCGNITDLFDNLIDAGADTWFGQESVNIKETIVKKYPGKIICGLSIEPPDLSSMDAVRDYTAKELAKYKGCKIWFRVPKKGISEEQSKLIFDMVAEATKK